MSNTKIKAGQFSGIVGHGVDGYFLKTNGDGTMAWAEGGASGPSVTSVDYPGDDLAADPAGNQSVVLTGTGFATSGMTVTIGGTTAPAVAHDSNTQLTITTPAKAAGDYDIVVTNGVTGASGTFVNGISYNGIPTWTTAAGSLGTLESETTISTITLAATEPDGGTITFNITSGALPSGLSLTGANIDGTTTAESSTTLYSFTVEAIDNENQSTPRAFSITVNSAEIVPTDNFTINTYTGNGSTHTIEGKIGTAASFNGSSSYINVDHTSLNMANNFTWSFWYMFNTHTYYDTPIGFFKGSYTNFIDATSSGELSFYDGNSRLTTPSSTFTAGTWYHISVTKSSTLVGGKARIFYVNGSEVASDAVTTNSSGGGGRNLLGGYSSSGNPTTLALPFDGKLDQVRIFSKSLSSSEVSTLAAESNSSSSISTTDIFDDGSGVALYEFKNGAKDTGGGGGKIGAAASFNGSSSKIVLSNYIVGDWNTGNQTISFWVKFNDFNNDHTIYTETNTQYLRGYANIIFDTTKKLKLQYHQTNGASGNRTLQEADFSSEVVADTWYNMVITGNDSSTSMYINGVSKTVTKTTGLGSSNSNTTSAGKFGEWDSGGDVLDGYLDQVRFFNTTLPATGTASVATLYAETSSSSTKSTTDIFSDGSGVALYEFEENSLSSNFQKGAVFNGSSSKIQLPSGVSVATGNNDFTLSTWVYLNSLSSQVSVITTQANYYFYIKIGTTGNVRTYNGNVEVNSSAGVITTGQWYNIVATLDSTNGKNVYVNGTNVANSSDTSNCNAMTTGHNALGYYSSNGSTSENYLNGKIDQVRIFNTALGSSDITKLYNESSQIPTTNLTAHYKLNGDAKDSAGSYDGTESNIAYAGGTYSGADTDISYAFDGTPTNVDFVGMSFAPDFVWIKTRSDIGGSNHFLFDTIRGATNRIRSNIANAEGSDADSLTSFNSNGFTVDDDVSCNNSGSNVVAWCWKAASSNATNDDGSNQTIVRANTDAGFSIVKFSNNNSNTNTFGHGLGGQPELVFIKGLNVSNDWFTYVDLLGKDKRLKLNTTDSQSSWSTNDGTNTPTGINSTTLSFAYSGTSYNFIAYCFRSIPGYQKIGSYSSDGSNKTIDIGFRPRWVMIKNYSSSGNYWVILDNLRTTGTNGKNRLYANDSYKEDTSINVSFNATDFTILTSNSDVNGSGKSYIYLAIA